MSRAVLAVVKYFRVSNLVAHCPATARPDSTLRSMDPSGAG